MNKTEIWQAIEAEMKMEKKLHPNWPDHAAAQAGRVTEASGSLIHECMAFKYNQKTTEMMDEIRKERMKSAAIKTAVTALRFLENLK